MAQQAALDWSTVARFKAAYPELPLIVKGVLSVRDAMKCLEQKAVSPPSAHHPKPCLRADVATCRLSGRRLIDGLGAKQDGIWVSNHGGRQLDQTHGAMTVLPKIATAVRKRMVRQHSVRVGSGSG
eukprot:SAG11_NODE_6792_length_1248_cov_1.080070_1_plen_126_part_00